MTAELIARLRAELGDRTVVTDADELAIVCTDWKGTTRGRAICLVLPRDTAMVAAAVRICRAAGVPLVPQGGNTGLAAGAVPDASGSQILLSLRRMARIRETDPIGLTVTAEAGSILADLQAAAAEAGLLLPISFAAEGSATVGGAISTNAGGVNVLRYGQTRASVLGLEVVLADGTVLDMMRPLRKDNAGYDLKQLFIGSEGTLGIVTAAVLRLMPAPRHRVTTLIEVASPVAALDLLRIAQEALGDQISAFELISPASIGLLRSALGTALPLAAKQWLVLLEAASALPGIREATEAMLATAFERTVALDGVVAESEMQAAALWAIREHVTEAEAKTGKSAKHDISVPIARVPDFLQHAAEALNRIDRAIVVNVFGHLGDGNLHYNVMLTDGLEPSTVNTAVHAVVSAMGGSISAEHGIGTYRVDELPLHRSPQEMTLLNQIKTCLDPDNVLNPGKVLRAARLA
jgi:FAD/FMN-containing dehydrogenase